VFTYNFYTPPDITSGEISVRVNNEPQTTGITINTTAKTVTFDSGLDANDEVLIYRDLNQVRNTNFSLSGNINSTTLNNQLDRTIAYIQDVDFKMQRFSIQFTLQEAYNAEFTILGEAYNAFNIDSVVGQTDSGTTDYTVKLNDAAVTDLTSIGAGPTKVKTTPSSPVSIDPTDKISILLSDNANAQDLSITFLCSRVAA